MNQGKEKQSKRNEMRFLNPRNDVAFKKVFGEEASKPLLVSFLNSVLDLKGQDQIEVLEFLNPLQLPITRDRKLSIIDILCQDQKQGRYIVEMQLGHFAGFEKRAQLYTAGTYVRQHQAGAKYTELKPVVFLGILDYKAFPEEEGCKSHHRMLSDKHYKQYLSDMRYTFIELPKFHKKLDELESLEDKWLYFLKHAEEGTKIPEALSHEKPIVNAYEALERFNWTEAQIAAYEHARLDDEVLQAQEEAGIQKGLAMGRLEELRTRRTIAKQLKHMNVETSTIAKVTGLSEKEVEAVLEEG